MTKGGMEDKKLSRRGVLKAIGVVGAMAVGGPLTTEKAEAQALSPEQQEKAGVVVKEARDIVRKVLRDTLNHFEALGADKKDWADYEALFKGVLERNEVVEVDDAYMRAHIQAAFQDVFFRDGGGISNVGNFYNALRGAAGIFTGIRRRSQLFDLTQSNPRTTALHAQLSDAAKRLESLRAKIGAILDEPRQFKRP